MLDIVSQKQFFKIVPRVLDSLLSLLLFVSMRCSRYLLFLFVYLFPLLGHAADLRLGFITDIDDAARFDVVTNRIAEEVSRTMGTRYNIVARKEDRISTNWDRTAGAKVYQDLSSRCDVIIVLGTANLQSILKTSLPKPTFALGVVSPSLQGIPLREDGTSGVKNFTYVLLTKDVPEELRHFHALTGFKKVGVFFESRLDGLIDSSRLNAARTALEMELGAKIQLIGIGEDVEQSLKELPEDIDAAYIAMTWERGPKTISSIAKELKQRKIPSFSGSEWHVQRGIMGAFGTENGPEETLRKLAIMIDDAASGAKLAQMSVKLFGQPRLILNIDIMREVGFAAKFETLFTAKVVRGGAEARPVYDLVQVAQAAINKNLDVKLADVDQRSLGIDYKNLVSQYLPDVDFSANLTQLSDNQANIFQPESSLAGRISLTQVLFSQSLILGIQLQSLLVKAQNYAAKNTLFNVLADVFLAYFNVLAAKTNVDIQEENLQIIQRNLQVARLQSRLGASGLADVYRLESEVASASQALVDAVLNHDVSTTRLNTLTGNALPEEFDLLDITVDDALFLKISQGSIGRRLIGPMHIAKLREKLVNEAYQQTPAKKQLIITAQALKKQKTSNIASYFSPDLAVQAQIDQPWWQDGAGAPDNLSNDLQWRVTLNLTFPIFDGNRRLYNLQATELSQYQVALQTEALNNNLALAVASTLADLVRAKTQIHFTKTASENAGKNFELVEQAYKKGSVSVLQLLDAQSAALSAKQGYILSVYNYFSAFLQLENSIGFYSLLASKPELEAFEKRISNN